MNDAEFLDMMEAKAKPPANLIWLTQADYHRLLIMSHTFSKDFSIDNVSANPRISASYVRQLIKHTRDSRIAAVKKRISV